MIVVTGAAGFIGSCLIEKLNQENFNLIIAVDRFDDEKKNRNLYGKKVTASIDFEAFPGWLRDNSDEIEFLFHLGALTDTTEINKELFDNLNEEYSKKLWKICCDKQIPMIYASSAATYGDGKNGFKDNESELEKLNPLNLYGHSKHDFDKWVINQSEKPFYWAGLKFFNVFGPNEWHKDKMASMVLQMHEAIKTDGEVNLFESNDPNLSHGDQKRDFIYIKDLINILFNLMLHRKNSGIYNIGSGVATSFNELATMLFRSLQVPEKINYIELPKMISNKYQNFTCADIEKIKSIGIPIDFMNIQIAIDDYVNNHLSPEVYY